MEKADREQHNRFLRLFMEHEETLRLFLRSLLFNYQESRFAKGVTGVPPVRFLVYLDWYKQKAAYLP